MFDFIKKNLILGLIFIITLFFAFLTFLTFIDKSFIELSDKNLQGDFKLNSNTFSVSDFMAKSSGDSVKIEPTESLKIPSFLECDFNVDAKTVFYDNLTLEDVKGTVILKDEKATLKNMASKIFDGNLTINGTVNTQKETPTFDMDLGMNRFDISQSFNAMEMFQNMAPIAKALKGTLNMQGLFIAKKD